MLRVIELGIDVLEQASNYLKLATRMGQSSVFHRDMSSCLQNIDSRTMGTIVSLFELTMKQ